MKSKRLAICVSVLGLTGFCSAGSVEPNDYSDEAEIEQIAQLATEVFRLKLDRVERSGSQYNLVGVRSGDILMSRRLDSRTYFVHDQRYGRYRRAGVFLGPDEEMIKFGLELFRKLEIPTSEITDAVVFQENTQVAQYDSRNGTFEMEEQQRGQKFAKFTRKIDEIPVFSSGLTLALTEGGDIGFMQLHWPEIPKHVVTEAHRLNYKVGQRWEPPEQKGAIPESVEAGIVHSAAQGFLMDIYPAIRVVYTSEDERFGRKLTLHFDRHGNPVPMPREFDIPCPDLLEQKGR